MNSFKIDLEIQKLSINTVIKPYNKTISNIDFKKKIFKLILQKKYDRISTNLSSKIL